MSSPQQIPVAGATEIAIRLRSVNQLFNSLDPAPFLEKDLDDNAERFIDDWVRELSKNQPFYIGVHLPREEADNPETRQIPEAISNYFKARARMINFELRDLFRVGRRSLIIGMMVLVASFSASQIIPTFIPYAPLAHAVAESLILVGWVANWRPIEIYLYEWWPIRSRAKRYQRIAAAPIVVKAD